MSDFIYENERIYLKSDQGETIAEIVFPLMEGRYTIIHTFVDSRLRGQGIALQLIERAYEYIREKNAKCKPICSYARKWFDENPEKQDILENS